MLFVDDYTEAREMWGLYLRGCGYDVGLARDADEALARAAELRPDVVVMDLLLPGTSGLDAARAIARQEAGRPVAFVAATGCSDAGRMAAAREAGFSAVLIKPCDPPVLVRAIEDAARAARQRATHSRQTAS